MLKTYWKSKKVGGGGTFWVQNLGFWKKAEFGEISH